MKKIFSSLFLALTFALTCCFSSCCFYYSYDEFNQDLQKCEIVYVERYTQDMTSVEVLAELNEEQTDAVLRYLMEEGLWIEMPPTYITGTALRLTYEEYYWFLDEGTGTKYTLDGEVLQYTAGIRDGLSALLSQYAELPEWY